MWAAAVLPSITTDFTGIGSPLSVLEPPALCTNGEPRGHALGEARRHGRVEARLGRHVDRVARALFVTGGAAGAEIVLDPVEAPLPQLHDRLLRTRGVAVVALEAVAAR